MSNIIINLMETKHQVHLVSPMLGCDPEFFFEKDGKIIGSEKILPEKGLTTETGSKVIIDGIQAELNPRAEVCRVFSSDRISECFIAVQTLLQKHPGVTINFKQNVNITQEEMDSLSDRSKQFGCNPSLNVYDPVNEMTVKDASKFLMRSAGGHIHIGMNPNDTCNKRILDDENHTIIKLFDILLGNTCVLLDRDKGNAVRRKTYGKAGEFRHNKEKSIIEYRTLSNFWLHNYMLQNMVFGIARQVYSIAYYSNKKTKDWNNIKCTYEETTTPDFAKTLVDVSNMANVRKAIDTNNKRLARENWERVKAFILDVCYEENSFPITKSKIEEFEFFLSKGLDYWFKNFDPIKWWIIRHSTDNHQGFENFLTSVVRTARLAGK